MTLSDKTLHVYLRDINAGKRTSLSVLAGQVQQGARVLDVGIGSGALGRHLTARAGAILDGVTHNDAEAQLASAHYRRIAVADLEEASLAELFAPEQYDVIVCADVLEHLREPERILDACRKLLAAGGRLLISLPNAAYCGLIAELLHGDFRYRTEGLLDRTHLRFFTRSSFARLLEHAGWAVESVETIHLDLSDSEFKVAFDALPPAVARYVLAGPDADVYQFILSARPADVATPVAAAERPSQIAQAYFSAQLYLRSSEEGYREERKLVARGAIGELRQTLRFNLPELASPLEGLRLDPADRPGLFHLHGIRLLSADQKELWTWSGDLEELANTCHNQIIFRGPWLTQPSALLLLHGDDPWFELPIAPATLAAAAGGMLETEVGWPMSADYLPLTDIANDFAERLTAQHLELLTQQAQLVEAKARCDELAQAQATNGEALVRQGSEISQLKSRLGALSAQKDWLEHQQTALQRERNELGQRLHEIETSTVFRATRPIVALKMMFDRALDTGRHGKPRISASPIPPRETPVDVIVPVYRGLEDTRCCIESILSATTKAPFRLVVINDASPDPEVTAYLRQIDGSDGRLMVLENRENLGFVATVNRGMALAADRDVVLVNSDAEVANDWLDRLRRAAYSDRRVASVTPFSNNATICSYPRFCADNDLPSGYDTAGLDRLFAQENEGRTVDVPTGVGFCMYIRRNCLDEIGLFDVERFGKGYGEENDFCMRAHERGWRNLFALDTFVRHAGGVSFGAAKSPRERDAMAILQQLHPSYESMVHSHIAADSARSARLAVDVARIRAAACPAILFVVHNLGGGTHRQVYELASVLGERAVFFILRPTADGETLLERIGEGEAFQLAFRLPDELDALLRTLKGIGIVHVHYHHLLGHAPEVWGLPGWLNVGYDFTAHDYYAVCPQVSLTDHTNRYCGEEGPQQCGTCLRRLPAPGGVDIETWRAGYRDFLKGARHVFAPSADTARRVEAQIPGLAVCVVPHTDIPDPSALPAPAPRILPADAPLRVAVIGALGPIKGADLLEQTAAEAARRKLPLEFHLIGYAYRSLSTQPRTRLTIHGKYQEDELAELLAWLQPDVVWFPAQWPETYSYTLSACLLAGLPVVAPDLGAFPERLAGRAWTWVRPWHADAKDCAAFFDGIRQSHFVIGEPPAPAQQAPASLCRATFSYERDYLDGLAPTLGLQPLPHDFLATYRHGRGAGANAARNHVRRHALKLLIRMRNAPLLRGVARRVPPRWQTRVRRWLQT